MAPDLSSDSRLTQLAKQRPPRLTQHQYGACLPVKKKSQAAKGHMAIHCFKGLMAIHCFKGLMAILFSVIKSHYKVIHVSNMYVKTTKATIGHLH